MSDFFDATDLFGYIANELNYTKKDLVQMLGTSVATVSKWQNHTAIPSQEMYRKMLHFASLMDVDCTDFTISMYIECVLSFVYEDEYIFTGEIDYNTNRVEIQRNSDCRVKWIDIEVLTNKKLELF